MRRIWYYIIFTLTFFWQITITASAKTVIAIDPGHGGSNEGAEYLKDSESGIREKDLTLELAQLLKAELEKYDDIEVVLLRNSDIDISLQERAVLASEHDAQWIISLHFNESVKHNLYGAELWIPAEVELYEKSFLMAQEIESRLTALGLNSRGIKTRLNSDQTRDYYGIIREASNLGIPTILVEQCFVDAKEDTIFWSTSNALTELAAADADGIISYVRGCTSALSEIYPKTWNLGGTVVEPDNTPPLINNIDFCKIIGKTAAFSVKIDEPDSRLSYYDYSIDSENTWSPLFPWPHGQETLYVQDIAEDQTILFRIYNGYDLFSQSEAISTAGYQNITDTEIIYKKQPVYVETEAWEYSLLKKILAIPLGMEISVLVILLYITLETSQKLKMKKIFSSHSLKKAMDMAWDITDRLREIMDGRQTEKQKFLTALKTNFISHSIASDKINMDNEQAALLCYSKKMKFPKNKDMPIEMIQLILNLTYAFDYSLKNYNSPLDKKFFKKIYYIISEHLDWNLKYDWNIILRERELPLMKSDEADKANDLLYPLNLYMKILILMKGNLIAYEFANLIAIKECINRGTAPFILDPQRVKNIFNSGQTPQNIKKQLTLYALEQQAEFITTFLDKF